MIDKRELERTSSAYTLSDMEVFIFPELIYSLVLANIMSPRLWQWREDPWFRKMDTMTPYRRVMRLKQFIMEHYGFNLDLDTWGLTTKERELARFRSFIDEDTLRRSNALFGYEGDKYYFDIGIRTHFGLDKYEGNVIPYWKTETIEAMDAFRYRPNFGGGAGECVSLSTLYAAALFVVGRIPLKDIYLMATPLHSQNFVTLGDGVLTNNRRVVTKNMWFNGTELSARARRALENERVTVVAHESGWVHTVYPEGTIDRAAYGRFEAGLKKYLVINLDEDILCNFLRQYSEAQKCFQLRWHHHGTDRYIRLERCFAYEHGSAFQVNLGTRDALMAEIDNEEFQPHALAGRIVLNDIEAFVKSDGIRLENPEHVKRLEECFVSGCMNAKTALEKLLAFCNVTPRLPAIGNKTLAAESGRLTLDTAMSRDAVIRHVESMRAGNRVADLAFHAYRDVCAVAPQPYLYSAVTRNPVSVAATVGQDWNALMEQIAVMPVESIYDGPGRLAQPDEVWNFGRGDGVEKAMLVANLALARLPARKVVVQITENEATCVIDEESRRFPTDKGLPATTWNISDIATL